MVKKSKQSFSGSDLFQQEMADVVPLRTTQTTDSKKPRKPVRQRRPDLLQERTSWSDLPSPGSHPYALPHTEDEDGSSHRKNGVKLKTMQKLKRGRFPVNRQLDLHHMTTAVAHRVLLEFVAETRGETLECVRIIHGKGLRSENGPRLKLMTRQVLRDHHRVLAFTTCKQADGGTGAVDVLLKPT